MCRGVLLTGQLPDDVIQLPIDADGENRLKAQGNDVACISSAMAVSPMRAFSRHVTVAASLRVLEGCSEV